MNVRRAVALAGVAGWFTGCGVTGVLDGPPSSISSAATGVGGAAGDGGANTGGAGGREPDPTDVGGSSGTGIGGGGGGGGGAALIGHLSVTLRTGTGEFDGTDANELSLCLDATHCFPLNVATVNDFRVGELDVYHFDGVTLRRDAVDRVELRSANGSDAFRPGCVAVQFDGEPMHCNDSLDVVLGNAPGEKESFQDPLGLHLACATCYPETLTHGPLVGAVTASTARVLVRTDATRKVELRLKKAAAPGPAPVVATRAPSYSEDFTTQFDLTGLDAGQAYFFSFDVDGVPTKKGTGSFTTPQATHPPLRLAFGSCARNWSQPIFGAVADLSPDLFLFVGDNHYANTANLGGLRWNYRRSLEVPSRAALVAKTPTLAVWDDHDYVGNNTDGASPGKETALRVFREYWANAAYGTDATPGVFSTYRWGDVELFLLDDRYYRSKETDAKGSVLGAAQTTWLESALLASTATFKLLVNGSMWSANPGETWADFPGARQSLLDYVRDKKIGGVVLLAGDVHRSELRKLRRKAAGAYDLPEIISSPLANPGGNCPSSSEPDALTVSCLDGGNFFATLDFDTAAADPKMTARLRDSAGTSLASMVVLRSQLK